MEQPDKADRLVTIQSDQLLIDATQILYPVIAAQSLIYLILCLVTCIKMPVNPNVESYYMIFKQM